MKKLAWGAAAALALIAVLGAAAFAAKSHRLSGNLKDSPGGTISMKIQMKTKGKGKQKFTFPKKVVDIKVNKLVYVCNNGDRGSMSYEMKGGKLKRNENSDDLVYEASLGEQAGPQEAHYLFVRVPRNGKSATGRADLSFAETTNGVTRICTTGEVSLKAGMFDIRK